MSLSGGYDATPRIVVRSDIPIPDKRTTPRKGEIYPWKRMKVGDSFVWPDRGTLYKTRHQCASALNKRRINHRENYQMETREERQDDGSMKVVVRAWRIE